MLPIRLQCFTLTSHFLWNFVALEAHFPTEVALLTMASSLAFPINVLLFISYIGAHICHRTRTPTINHEFNFVTFLNFAVTQWAHINTIINSNINSILLYTSSEEGKYKWNNYAVLHISLQAQYVWHDCINEWYSWNLS